MTLATILLFCISWTAPALLQAAPSQAQPAPVKPADDSATQSQSSQPPAQNPSPASKPPATAPAQTSSGQEHATTPTKHPRRKKKVVSANCVTTPAGTKHPVPAGSDPTTSAPPTVGGRGSTPSAAASSAPTNCPPPKIIVRQGGTAEPSIQLAGGGGDQAASQRDTANRMLGATEQNLKKIAGLQLSEDQQGMVTQVRQFMEQSKTAANAGDLERARTLAWKAQLLSEELIKPQK